MPTPNINLPTITPSMSADVPRDINALAYAVDGAFGEVDRDLTNHINDTQKHVATSDRASWNKAVTDIGDKTLLATQNKTNLVAAVNEVFQASSDKNTKIAAAITEKGVPTSPSAPGDQMAANIRAIQTGKRYASGDSVVSGFFLEVRGLPFKPNIIVVKYVNSNDKGSQMAVYANKTSFTTQPNVSLSAFADASTLWQGQETIYADGFSLRISSPNLTNERVTWIAFE